MSENIDILDLKTALKVVSGNQSLAEDLLAMFIKELPTYKKIIENKQKAEDREELRQIIHKIHGGLRYLGAPALMAIISKTDAALFELSELELKKNIDKIFFEIDRVLKLEKYSSI